LLALAVSALGVVGFAPQASANFNTGKCAGPNIEGNGASFAKTAHEVFNFNFKTNYCNGTPGQGTINVTYNANGSGAGITTMELRNNASRFAGSDDPPTPAQVALMNSGAVEPTPGEIKADTNAANDGKAHVFPIAAGAVAPLVNFPEGCNPELLGDEFRTVSKAAIEGDATKKALLRVRFPKAKFEKVWAGLENGKWSDVFPELAGDGDCEVPIIRVVRFDKSGTTFAFKDYLRTIEPARGWTTTYESGANGNREWPGAEFGKRTDCPGEPVGPGIKPDNEDHLTSGCANGNGKLVEKLIATDGSIGYSDIATARVASPTLAINAAAPSAPTTPYWTQVQNGSGNFTEPTADEVSGFKASGGQRGSNCLSTEFKNTPSTSFGDWSKTSGANAATGFGICTLTYGLAFDDNAAVFGNTPEEEGKARTVKDYEESIVSPEGQAQLFAADYAPVPASLITISRAGVAEIGWNKAEDGCGTSCKKEEEKPTVETKATTIVAPPSNQFSLLKKTISAKTGGATLSVKLPGAGKLDVLGTAKAGKKKITVGHVVLNAGKGGTYSVTLKPSAAAKKVLAEKGKLSVSLKLTFSPTGGTENSSTSQVTLKMTQTSGKRRP
jgi:ABC-type phosphate transport system substrate-binding protein